MAVEVRGKVARVLTETQVAIALPAQSRVLKEDAAVVFEEFDVLDPDTKENLGSTRITIVRLRVVSVADRFCVARSFESFQKNPFDLQRELIKVTDSPAAKSAGWVVVRPGMPVLFTGPGSD